MTTTTTTPAAQTVETLDAKRRDVLTNLETASATLEASRGSWTSVRDEYRAARVAAISGGGPMPSRDELAKKEAELADAEGDVEQLNAELRRVEHDWATAKAAALYERADEVRRGAASAQVRVHDREAEHKRFTDRVTAENSADTSVINNAGSECARLEAEGAALLRGLRGEHRGTTGRN